MMRFGTSTFVILIALVGLARPGVAWSQTHRAPDAFPSAPVDAEVQEYLAAYASPSVRGPAPGSPPARTANLAPAIPADSLTAVVKQYCVVCHNDVMLTGNLTLSEFDVALAPEMAETAEKMIVKLRAGMMPIPGEGVTTAMFTEAGEYVLRVRANDASGVSSAGHAQCCWTNGFLRVTVTRRP